MGNPFSKGPTIDVRGEGNKQVFDSVRNTQTFIGNNNNIGHEPGNYNHRMAVMRSLNCIPFTSPSYATQQERDGNQGTKAGLKHVIPEVNFQWGELRSKLPTTPHFGILDYIPPQKQTDNRIIVDPLHKIDFNVLPNTTEGINPFPAQISFVSPSRDNNQNLSHRVTGDPTKATESKTDNIGNISKFFENGPKMANRGKEKETKTDKRKKQKKDLDTPGRRDEIDTRTMSDIDKADYSDWEVPINPFIQSYLDGTENAVPEKQAQKKVKETKIKAPSGTDDDTDETRGGSPEFKDEVETTRVTQQYEARIKKKRQKAERKIVEPPRGKGSFGRIQAEIEERKKKLSKIATIRERNRPDFEIMDPGDGEDEWGADRQLEPPPETVVVPWVPYGFKKVVAEDGTVTYTKPDTVYEKLTLDNLGMVHHEPMDEEEIAEYVREENEREKNPQTPKESRDTTDFSSNSEDEVEDIPSKEFIDSEESSCDPGYGIPTNVLPSGNSIIDQGYLSDADENQQISMRPTERKDLEIYLGDTVQAFRVENPDKDDEPLDFFEDMTKKEESRKPVENNENIKREENIEIEDDYSDGIVDGVESTDEYDDGLTDIKNILIKDTELTVKPEKLDSIAYGLPRVEVKQNFNRPCSGKFSLDSELILDDEDDNYEDDEEEEDYNDDLTHIKLLKKIETNPHIKQIENNRHNSDEDIDPSDESESYDSEEDDYEDNVKEDDYNDNIRLLESSGSEDEEGREIASEEELENLFKEKTVQEELLKIKNATDYFDPSILSNQSDSEEDDAKKKDGNIDIDDYFSDGKDDDYDDGDDNVYGDGDDDEVSEYDSLPSTTDSSESGDYAPEDDSIYGDDKPKHSDSEDSCEQDLNPTELLQEMELQGDTFDDFEYSMDNGTWVEFPYKNPGDPSETKYEDGEKQLPYWYYIKHPAEDDSLMHIRAKLADQYDVQCGPYNPFKVDPPPTPFWVDDVFDLVPKGVEVPDDFFPGFMKPDPETMHQDEVEYGDEDDEFYAGEEDEEADGRDWEEIDPDEIPRRRTWKSWRSRPGNEPSRPPNESWRAAPATSTQKIPKKNDQWQHYRDWLLRQGTKTAANTSEGSKDVNSEHLNLKVSVPEGRFTGKRIAGRQEQDQPRPHYQTWLTKQASAKSDPAIEISSESKSHRPQEIPKTTHKRYEESFMDDKWSETKQKPSINMWQHYQKWKQKDNIQHNETTNETEKVDFFVFSKPPEDINNSKESPYSKKDVILPENNDKITTNELSGLDQMKKSHNLAEDSTLKPPPIRDSSTTVSNDLTNSTAQLKFQEGTFDSKNDWKPGDHTANISKGVPQYSQNSPSPIINTGFYSTATSGHNNDIGFDERLALKSNNIKPRYTSEQVPRDSEKKECSIMNTKVLKRSSLKSVAESNLPTKPKLEKLSYFKNDQVLHSPTHVLQLDYNLNFKTIDQKGTKDNFVMDVSRPYITSKYSHDVSSETFENYKVIPNLILKPYHNLTKENVVNIINNDMKASENISTTGTENNASTSIEIKPKRKYTRRKPRDPNFNESAATGSVTATNSTKRKYTRRVNISPRANVETTIKSDDSSPNLFNESQEKTIQDYSYELPNPTKTEYESSAKEALDMMFLPENSRYETVDDPIISINNDSNEFNIAKNNEVDSFKISSIGNNANDNRSTDNGASSMETPNQKYNNIIQPKLKVLKVSPNKHWQQYQTYVTEHVIKPTSTIESPSTIDSQSTFYESKIYTPSNTLKPRGNHWLHYTAWLEKKNIQKPLYKTPTTRPVMSLRNKTEHIEIRDQSLSNRETTLQPIEENIEQEVTNVGNVKVDHITDEKVEYLHQRWLVWQQHLASKMINKLNKMLKYYENPEGSISHETVKVRDMIKQRDYWREIHRWSSKKSFKLYNNFPPQTNPATSNLSSLNQQRVRPLRPAKTEYHYVEPSESPGFQKYKQWSSPDPDIVNAQPTAPEKSKFDEIEAIKPQVQLKRPVFPGQSKSTDDIKKPVFPEESQFQRRESVYAYKKPKFPDQRSFETTFEPLDISNKPKFQDQEMNIEYSRSAPSSRRSREINSGQRKPLYQEEAFEDKFQDQFFREVSELLGEDVRVEGKVKTSKSRAEKRLKRRLKAKYQEEKKGKSFEKRYGDFLDNMDRSSDDEED